MQRWFGWGKQDGGGATPASAAAEMPSVEMELLARSGATMFPPVAGGAVWDDDDEDAVGNTHTLSLLPGDPEYHRWVSPAHNTLSLTCPLNDLGSSDNFGFDDPFGSSLGADDAFGGMDSTFLD